MKTYTVNIFTGLFLIIFLAIGGASADAQILKNATGKVSDAGKTASNPIKDARQTVKEVGQVPRDIQNAKQDITRPAQDLQREVDGLQNDINSTKNDLNGLRGQKQADKDEQARRDSLAAAEEAGRQAAYDSAQARADSVYRSKLRTGKDMGSNKPAATTEVVTSDQSRTVLLPPNTIKSRSPNSYPTTRTRTRSGTIRSGTSRTATTRTGSTTRTSTGSTRTGTSAAGSSNSASSAAGSNPTASTTRGSSPASSSSMRYANSPAKRYLERADFDEETLNDLFEAAIWTGPDSVHTARSIDYMLQQYRMDIDEVKRIDPNFDVDGREDRYRKWSGLFYRNTRPLKED